MLCVPSRLPLKTSEPDNRLSEIFVCNTVPSEDIQSRTYQYPSISGNNTADAQTWDTIQFNRCSLFIPVRFLVA